jgi:hypothetical protein
LPIAALVQAAEFAAACGAFDTALDKTGYTPAQRRVQLDLMKAYLVDGQDTADTGAYVVGIAFPTWEAAIVLIESWIVVMKLHRELGDGSEDFVNGRALNSDDNENFYSRMQHVTPERFRQKFNKQGIEFEKRTRSYEKLGYHYAMSNTIYRNGGNKRQRFNVPESRKATRHTASLEATTAGGQHDAPFRRSTGNTLTKPSIFRYSSLQQEPAP